MHPSRLDGCVASILSKKEKIDKSTLGDIEALADLKKQLEDNEKSD